jgi:hypothetical protein
MIEILCQLTLAKTYSCFVKRRRVNIGVQKGDECIMNGGGCARKRSWPRLGYCAVICLVELRENEGRRIQYCRSQVPSFEHTTPRI